MTKAKTRSRENSGLGLGLGRMRVRIRLTFFLFLLAMMYITIAPAYFAFRFGAERGRVKVRATKMHDLVFSCLVLSCLDNHKTTIQDKIRPKTIPHRLKTKN